MLLFAPLLLSPLVVVAPGRARSSPGRNAAKDGDCEALRLLLESGWRAELDRDRRGASALHMAAGHGHTPALAELLGSMDVVGVRGQSGASGGGVAHRGRLLELDLDAAAGGAFDGLLGLVAEAVGP